MIMDTCDTIALNLLLVIHVSDVHQARLTSLANSSSLASHKRRYTVGFIPLIKA
jgi:hypothetical protein